MTDYYYRGVNVKFNCSITSVRIGYGVTAIEPDAFYGCTSLKSVTIPSSVKSIGVGAFSGCTSLAEITVSSGNEHCCSVDGVLFDKGKKTLIRYPAGKTETSYKMPDSVTSIEDGAFEGCVALESITIPDSVTSIGYSAFGGCVALESVTIPDRITFIRYRAARYRAHSVEDIRNGAFAGCPRLTKIVVTEYKPARRECLGW